MNDMNEDCLFCSIVRKEIPSDVVHESESILAFRDINPAARVHALFIPKRHIASAAEVTRDDGELLGELFEAMAALAEKEGLGDGYRIVTNVGRAAGQSVHHLHFHVIGGRAMTWPPG